MYSLRYLIDENQQKLLEQEETVAEIMLMLAKIQQRQNEQDEVLAELLLKSVKE